MCVTTVSLDDLSRQCYVPCNLKEQLKAHLHDEKVSLPFGLPLMVSPKGTLPVRDNCGEMQTTFNLLTNTPVTATPSNKHTMLSY